MSGLSRPKQLPKADKKKKIEVSWIGTSDVRLGHLFQFFLFLVIRVASYDKTKYSVLAHSVLWPVCMFSLST